MSLRDTIRYLSNTRMERTGPWEMVWFWFGIVSGFLLAWAIFT